LIWLVWFILGEKKNNCGGGGGSGGGFDVGVFEWQGVDKYI
jgi:hypothetical protein